MRARDITPRKLACMTPAKAQKARLELQRELDRLGASYAGDGRGLSFWDLQRAVTRERIIESFNQLVEENV